MMALLLEILVSLLMLAGGGFMLLAALGVARMPDLYIRMHAASKVGTLGLSCAILALALYFQDAGTAARAFLVVVFLFMTAPVAAHMIGRAAYSTGVPLAPHTVADDMKGKYDPKTHDLGSDEGSREETL